MSKHHFYSHLVETKELEVELDSLDLSEKEKNELLDHVHGSIHYRVLDTIFSQLPEKDKQVFVGHLNNEDHEKIWEHLLRGVVGIEEKIRDATRKVIDEFREEVKKIKQNRNN